MQGIYKITQIDYKDIASKSSFDDIWYGRTYKDII